MSEKTLPEVNINDERSVRMNKVTELSKLGIPSFPAVAPEHISVAAALNLGEGEKVTLNGRLMTKREMGKLTFCHLQDESGRMQIALKSDEIDKDSYKTFTKLIDSGDIVSVTGERFTTHKGEPSVLVKEWTLLTKALLPLPDKFHGLQDEETRLRKRYLDLTLNPDLREIFRKKSMFWDVTRRFMKEKGFFEVETPLLETTTGGAEATPFATHHNDFDLDVFLRISVGELWQKRLMAAGYEKTFEIGRVFRNEGSSPDHLQEFTNMEFYWAYANYKDGMKLVTELYRTIAKEVFGTTKFTTKGYEYDLADEWVEIDYVSEVKKKTGIDVLTASEDEMKAKLAELGVVYEGENRERLTDTLWKYCRKTIAGPAFLVNHPKLVSALSKEHPENSNLTERFQVLLAGSEIGNGYSELNDPIDQRQRFEIQQKLLERGDSEAMMPDWEFVEMLEHGMPPTCGFGFGERLFAYMMDKPIRECVLFPLMKPESADNSEFGKSKKTMVAHALILNTPEIPEWSKLNAAAHLSAALAAREGRKLIHIEKTKTTDGEVIPMNIQHAIVMKETSTREDLLSLKRAADELHLTVTCFTEEMRDSSNDEKVKAKQESKSADEIGFLGVLVYGDKKTVEKLTDKFGLMK